MSAVIEWSDPTRRFTVETNDVGSWVYDGPSNTHAVRLLATHYPDHVERAQAAADELEARLNPPPEWIVDNSYLYRRNRDGWWLKSGVDSTTPGLLPRVAYLLNTYGLDGDA